VRGDQLAHAVQQTRRMVNACLSRLSDDCGAVRPAVGPCLHSNESSRQRIVCSGKFPETRITGLTVEDISTGRIT
jgi:hypothetical protein